MSISNKNNIVFISLSHNSQLKFVTEDLIHVEAVQSVFLRTEPQIAGVVEPQCDRVPVSYKEPLPDVKLCVVYQEWTL